MERAEQSGGFEVGVPIVLREGASSHCSQSASCLLLSLTEVLAHFQNPLQPCCGGLEKGPFPLGTMLSGFTLFSLREVMQMWKEF